MTLTELPNLVPDPDRLANLADIAPTPLDQAMREVADA